MPSADAFFFFPKALSVAAASLPRGSTVPANLLGGRMSLAKGELPSGRRTPCHAYRQMLGGIFQSLLILRKARSGSLLTVSWLGR